MVDRYDVEFIENGEIKELTKLKTLTIEATIIKKRKKENKNEFGEYIKLFDDDE